MARILSRIIPTVSCQAAFAKTENESFSVTVDETPLKRKNEIGLEDYFSVQPRNFSEDFSFLTKSPQEFSRNINFLQRRFEPTFSKPIKWSWEDFGEMKMDMIPNSDSSTYGVSKIIPPFGIETNNSWNYLAIPSSGSLWLFCVAFFVYGRKKR